MGPSTAAAIGAAIQLIIEATRAIERIKSITQGETRDLTPEELASVKVRVDSAYADFEAKLRDRGVI
jgi:hypothetical protein